METSISLTKIMTVIQTTGNFSKVTNHKMGDFVEVCKDLNSLNIWGIANPSKMNKYVNILTKMGFVASVNWINNFGLSGKDADVVSYSINFSK